jgi:EAL domain-containing protein (putative c-di-GMP-specific phosphodiesterase class I)
MGNMALPGSAIGIGRRIGRLVASAVFSAVVIAALALSYVQVSKDIANRREVLQNISYTLAAAVADAVLKADRQKAMEALSAVSRIPDLRMVVLHDAHGNSIASLGQTAILQGDIASMDGGDFTFLFKGVMPVAVDIVKGGKKVGRLLVLADIGSARSDFIDTIVRTLVAAILAALAGVLLSQPLQRRIVSPVTALTEQITSIRRTRNYHADLEVKEDIGEVGTLVEAFKGLMADVRHRDQSLQQLAYIDPLTGLANREKLFNDIAQDPQAMHHTALAVFSVHGHQSFSLAFGQSFADAVLLSAASALKDNAGGASVYRTGANDFAILFRDCGDDDDVERNVAHLLAVFVQPLVIMRSEIKIDVDCGVVRAETLGTQSHDGENLLRAATLALNEAARTGPNHCMHFRPRLLDEATRYSRLAQDLRVAISQNTLDVDFQPVLQLKSNRISGFEALARWKHPEFGSVSPAVFVPIAESHGLIVELSEQILRKSCATAAAWRRRHGVGLTVSVNASVAQFLQSDFAAKVSRIAAEHDLPPHLLCLEVTESIFAGTALSEIRNTLNILSAAGIQLALDDFGSGYSSLGYLAKLPFNILKIDRSFVSNADLSERREAILRSIVAMSHSIGLEVVAEGAETAAEIALLTGLEVDKIQGYGVGRPMPEEQAIAFARAWRVPELLQSGA